MLYLLNPRKKISKAHLWTGSDSYCSMFTTGGMRKEKQQLFETPLGKKICLMCSNVKKSRNKNGL